MKIPYTFVLLSSCVMISSAMAMIEPNDGEAVTTSTTTLPLAKAPATDTATGTDTDLNTTPPAFDPRAIADDANDASRQAIVRDADEDSSTGSYESSSDNDDEADDKTAAPAASTSSTSDTASTTLPTLTFTKISPQMTADGAYVITEQLVNGRTLQVVRKKPSQLFNLQTERQLFGEYWKTLQKTVGDFVEANKDDKASFFIRPMTSLLESMKSVNGDVNHLLTCEDRIFDDPSNMKNVTRVIVGTSEFLLGADYHMWMSKMSKSNPVYPWMAKYPTMGMCETDGDKGENNIFKHLEKMTAADRAFHAQLPFVQYLSSIMVYLCEASNAVYGGPAVSGKKNQGINQPYVIAGENKWERPEVDPHLASMMRGLSRIAVESGNIELMSAMMERGDFDPAAAFGSGLNPFASLGGRPGMPNVAAMRAGSENREDDNGNQSDSDDEAAPTATGNAETGASNSAPRGVQCAQQ